MDLGLGVPLVSLVQDWIGSSQESSQFASALLLSSRAGEWDVSIPAGANPDELPYVDRWEGGVRTGHAANRFAFLIWPLDI